MVEEEQGAAEQAALRADYKPAKKRGRKPKVREPELRHDSEALAPIDGHGNPFVIKLKPGYVACWLTDLDRRKHGSRRRMDLATWGDPRIVQYDALLPGNKGEPVQWNELTCYIMTVDEVARIRKADAARQVHDERARHLKTVAEGGSWMNSQDGNEAIQVDRSGPNGERGFVRFNNNT